MREGFVFVEKLRTVSLRQPFFERVELLVWQLVGLLVLEGVDVEWRDLAVDLYVLVDISSQEHTEHLVGVWFCLGCIRTWETSCHPLLGPDRKIALDVSFLGELLRLRGNTLSEFPILHRY